MIGHVRGGRWPARKAARLRRIRRARAAFCRLKVHRLCVNRTPRHIYAQVITADGAATVASASTLEKELIPARGQPGKIEAAKKAGELIARRALGKGIDRVAFDRSGFHYHGRVRALAEAARANGLKF